MNNMALCEQSLMSQSMGVCIYKCNEMEKTKEGTRRICLDQYDVAASLKQILNKNFNETLLLNEASCVVSCCVFLLAVR